MNLRQQLRVAAGCVLAVMLTAVASVYQGQLEQGRAAATRQAAERLVVDVLALLSHTQEYALHGHARVVRQWQHRHEGAGPLIDFLSGRGRDLDHEAALTRLPERWRDLGDVFQRLLELRRPDSPLEPTLRDRASKVLVDRLVSEVQVIAETVLEVGRSAAEQRDRTDAMVQRLTLAAAVLVTLCFLAIFWLVHARVLAPLVGLQAAVQALRDGDRGRRLDSAARDEVGELARSFDDLRVELDIRERAVASSENFLRGLIEALPNALVHVDRAGRITTVNAAAEALFGYARRELVGQPVEILLPPEQREAHERHRARRDWQQPEVGSVAGARSMRGRRADGEVFDVRIALAELGEGEQAGTVALAVDINELIERGQALERSNAELSRFAYVASHDLQEPPRAVTSCNELLKETCAGRLDAEALELIDFSIAAGRRMQDLIRDLLAYSRIDSRGAELQPVEAREVCDLAVANLRIALAESGASIRVGDLPRVQGDSRQLLQLFQNLVGNAIKYRGEAAPVLEVSAQRQGRFWVFCVSDNGIGIDPRFHERVFDIFKRLHGQDRYEGTGIGLAICARVVQRHGGRIWVESQPGEGSRFYFTLRDAALDGGAEADPERATVAA